ncbi:MAG: C4-dicarboxylate ABC transporter, partial [Thiovulaceae bacterium]|nr:C4-dicarboxylate ABC transporter [Sulfurimonadaceae bacterium]
NMTHEFHAQNILALQKLKSMDVTLSKFPKDVIEAGKKALDEVLSELSSKNQDFELVYKEVRKYLALSKEWSDVSLGYFINER